MDRIFNSLWQDVRYAVRGMRNQPSFTAIAIVTLAIGIGAAATIFSVIHSVLLDPFPYANAESIAGFYVHDMAGSNPFGRSEFNIREFLTYQKENRVFDDIIGSGSEAVLYRTSDGVESLSGSYVTPNLFQVLGVPALIGRAPRPDDATPGQPSIFVMSYKTWVQRFNADPSIVGKTFVLNNVPTLLVGVMPKRFTKRGADLWRIQVLDPASRDWAQQQFQFQGRMKPGITLKQVEQDITSIAHRLALVYPAAYPTNFDIRAETWLDGLVRQFRTTLYTLAAAVAMLVLIACGNVANMLLARATAREKEIAIRSAMGAGRGRIVRQLLSESVVLALAGAAAGCVAAYFGIKALVALIPENTIPGEAVIALDWRALLFSLVTAFVTACLFGLAPTLQISRSNLADSLKSSGKGVSGGFRKGRLRNALVTIEVTLSLILLAGAGLLMRSFVRLQALELGFSPEQILVARVPFPTGQYAKAIEKQRFFEALSRGLAVVHGIRAHAVTTTLPPFGGIRGTVDIIGTSHSDRWESITTLCSEGYFSVMGMRLLQGRVPSEIEIFEARKTAVVNRAFVRKYLGGQNPLGRQIRLPDLENLPREQVRPAVFEIIGVVNDASNQGLNLPPVPEAFIPHTVSAAFDRLIVVKTTGEPVAMLDSLRREIHALDRNIALTRTDSLENFMKRYLYADPRFSMVLLGTFACIGLVLVSVGIYSVMAYAISRQSQEIAVRMALGASRRRILLMVLRLGGRLLLSGIVLGVISSVLLTRSLTYQLTNISAFDPLTMVLVVSVVLFVGFAACYFPAMRATRLNPVAALRND